MKDIVALGRYSLAGLRMLAVATLVLGIGYPLLVTGIAQVALPWRADGSLVTATGAHTTSASDAVGSALIGQGVTGKDLFLPRPSAAGDGYDPLATAASNLGPESPVLIKEIEKRKAAVAAREGVDPSQVPPDAVTASGSGLDPDISVAYADLQVPRVARAQGLSESQVRALVEKFTSGRSWGTLGEPHVNVLLLNIAVREAAQARSSS